MLTTVGELADDVRARPASVGGVTLVGIDGFSGAGKTELAQALAGHEDIATLSIEAFYPGWEGLAAGVARARAGLVEPLERGDDLRWRAWDWARGTEGAVTTHAITTPVLLLEGCGAGSRALREHEALTIWVHARPGTREDRLRARDDWGHYAPFRRRWEQQEQELAAREGLPGAADLVVAWRADGRLDAWTSSRR